MLVNIGDFFAFLGNGLLLYLLFACSAAALWFFLRWLDASPRSELTHIAVALVGGPLLLSWALVYTMYVVPGRSPKLYIAGLLLLVTPCLLLLRKRNPGTRLRFADYPLYLATPLRLVILSLLLIGFGVLLFLISFLPLAGNDPLEYMQVGREFAEQRSTRWYPSISGGDAGGVVAPWTHPPAYPGLIAIAYFIQGTVSGAGIARLIAPWFVAALLVGTIFYTGARRWSTGPLAALLLLGTPLLFDLTVLAHVDCLRWAALVAAVLAARVAGVSSSKGSLYVLALACGMLLFTHSIGFVMMPIAIAVFFLVAWLNGRNLRSTLIDCGLVIALAVVFVVPQLLQNLRIFGSILQDHVALYGLPQIRITEFLEATRFISTIGDKLVFGVFASIFDVQQFGFAGALALAALLRVVWRVIRRSDLLQRPHVSVVLGGETIAVAAFIVVVFTGGALISVAAGTVLLIKNPRYLMTIQPFTAILAANLLTDLLYAARRSMRRTAHRRSAYRVAQRQPLVLVHKKVRLNPIAKAAQFLVSRAAHAVTAITRPTAWVTTGLLLIAITTASSFPLTFLREAVFTYRISLRTLFDPEFAKRAALDWAPARIERVMADHARPGEKVLSFRQADTGFYTSVPFISHADERLVPVFDAPDPRSAYDRLLTLGVRWLYVPGYAMPEISNSVIERLLFDTRLTSLVAEDAGWKAVRLRDSPLAEVKSEEVAGQDYGARPADSLQWNVIKTSASSERFGEIATAVRRVDVGGPISIDAEDDWFTRRDVWRILTRGLWSGNLAGSGFLTRSSDFAAKFGVYLLTAEVEGAGYVEVAVSQDLRDNLVDRSFRHVVWSGVLSKGRRRTILGVFRMGENPNALAGMLYQDQLAQVLFRVHQRSQFKLLKWKIEHVNAANGEDAIFADGETLDANIFADGWSSLDGYAKEAPLLKIQARADGAPSNQQSLPPLRPVEIHQLNSKVATLISPILSPLELGSYLPFEMGQRTILPMLEIETDIRGTALGLLTAYLECSFPAALLRKDEDRPKSRPVTPELKAREQLEDRFIVLELGKVFAQPQLKRHRFVLRPPCQPASIRIGYNLSGYVTSQNGPGRGNHLEVHGIIATYREAAQPERGILTYRPLPPALLIPTANPKP